MLGLEGILTPLYFVTISGVVLSFGGLVGLLIYSIQGYRSSTYKTRAIIFTSYLTCTIWQLVHFLNIYTKYFHNSALLINASIYFIRNTYTLLTTLYPITFIFSLFNWRVLHKQCLVICLLAIHLLFTLP
jgi:hypothetical protein